MAEFFDMGGYARFVWSAWSISLIVLTATVILVRGGLRRTFERLQRRHRSRTEAQT